MAKGVVGRVRRGEVYHLDLSKHGGTIEKERPVLVVQNDMGNRHSPETIVVAIRDPHGGRMLPVFVPVKKGMGGVTKDCVVDAAKINAVHQKVLPKKASGKMSADVMQSVDKALAVSLGLACGKQTCEKDESTPA